MKIHSFLVVEAYDLYRQTSNKLWITSDQREQTEQRDNHMFIMTTSSKIEMLIFPTKLKLWFLEKNRNAKNYTLSSNKLTPDVFAEYFPGMRSYE